MFSPGWLLVPLFSFPISERRLARSTRLPTCPPTAPEPLLYRPQCLTSFDFVLLYLFFLLRYRRGLHHFRDEPGPTRRSYRRLPRRLLLPIEWRSTAALQSSSINDV